MAAPDPVRALNPDPDVLPLREGRTLTLASVGADDLVEIRSATGTVEVRIRLTEDGPVLEMESVRLSLSAKESIDVDAENVNVRAREDVRVTGAMIYLN